jgi:hypothetical protein
VRARSVIRNHLLQPFGARLLEDITEDDVDRWARWLGSHGPLSNARKRMHGCLELGSRRTLARPTRTPAVRRTDGRATAKERSPMAAATPALTA